MELHTNNVDQFITCCTRKAREDTHPTYNHSSETSSEEDQNSFLIHYMDTNDLSSNSIQSNTSDEISSLDTPSLCSNESYDIESNIECMDDNCTVSITSITSTNDQSTCDTSLNGDMIPKSFLQLSGITVGNYNMGCNFHISAALWIMIQYNINILAIQEHTAWNRNLLPHELTSIERHCNKWGYFATISKLQIIIIDKQLLASHSETLVFHEGRVLQCRFQITTRQFATFLSVYGIPHSGNGTNYHTNLELNENSTLQEMEKVQSQIRSCVKNAYKSGDIVFVFGDLQDTPDNTTLFHYGKCRMPKHPLGIVKVCEELNMTCSIYLHAESLEKPIISRHGLKGGRFIDGMYACKKGLEKILGISIINDTGISSDHALVIGKIDLGTDKFETSNEHEERIDYRRIMNIPMHIKPDDVHPTINMNVYKGADFRMHAQLYNSLYETANDSEKGFPEKILALNADRIKNYISV
jgi:hypothetical protein